MELTDLVNLSNDLTQMVIFPTQIPDCDSHSPALWFYFFLLTLVFFLQWFSLHYEILIVLLSQFQLPFLQTQKCMTSFITWLMTTLELIGTVFVIIWEMFHGRISLNSVLLLLLVSFVSRFWLESMYIYLVVSINSSLTHLHSFQLLVLLP